MERLGNGVYREPPPEQKNAAYKNRVMQERSDLMTRCAEIIEQDDREHAEAARDYHNLDLKK